MDRKTPIEQQWKNGKLKALCIDFEKKRVRNLKRRLKRKGLI